MSRSRFAIAGPRISAAVTRALIVGGLAVMLAGCYTQREVTRYPPGDYRERHPITLTEGPRTIELFLGRNRGGLSATQRAEVLAFARSWRHEANGGIVVEVPARSANKLSAQDSLREVHSIFAAAGIPPQSVYMLPYAPDVMAPASIRVKYSRLIAKAGPCGAWPSDIGPSFDPAYNDNGTYWNLGCATQHNLAAMIDNPADLVQPRGETPPYRARRSITMDKYRKGENPAGTYDKYDQGKISGLGK